MSAMVQAAIAGDATEAEEIQDILRTAGIRSELSSGLDEPLHVLVPEESLDAAKDAIEAMTERDDVVSDA
jgi:hypothetical protein